ncbi:penicillin-binding protein 1A [Geobacter benzoatilyticus]|uniref:Penicillin-binding protein 1A n=1 Tax=Geobacter benzoatilyticus TaxID=2815309 RepID=A0ABX7Q6K1_9BACT|nr:PBP1A family penicillin-binding protein [Geobacter benzoatilyticus]QSV47082.1 PBP1A family penicillin-binding protein [Geobacter benzoatilyticus]
MTLSSGRQNLDPRNVNRRRGKSPWKIVAITVASLGFAGLLAVSGYLFYLYASLPLVDRLADYKPPIVTQVFGDDGSLVGEFYLERRIVVPVDKIPRKLIQAFVAAEDSNFYQHKGLDYLGIARAAMKNLISLRKKEGASTITQQVAKSMLLTPEKSFSRKFKEAILATRMEKMLSKDDILYIYLNQIYLGGGSYGVQVAAETYFGKNVEQLNLAEMAMLAGLPKAPNSYSPIKHLDRAKERQAYVLERMVREGYVTQAEADHALATPIVISSMKKVNSEQSAYFLEHIRIKLEETYGMDRLYKEGLKVYTTMSAEMQKGAYDAVVNGLKNVDKRQGFRGEVKHLAETEVDGFCRKIEDGVDTASLKQGSSYQGVVTAVNSAKGEIAIRVGDRTGTITQKNMSWAGKVQLVNSWSTPEGKGKSLSLGSVVFVSVLTPDINKQGAVLALDQEPQAQAAVVALDPRTGAVKAMVGGYDFRRSQFNRAVQAKRNPGSAFKPIIYAAALDKGLTAATTFDDSPVEYESGGEKAWKPKNYDNIYRGMVTMREALTDSINVVSVRILEQIGVDAAIEYAKKLGITSPLAANLTLALGSSSVTPLELTSAYGVFASGGYRTTPYVITKVEDSDGSILEEAAPPVIPVFSNQSTVTLTNDDLTVGAGNVSAGPAVVPVIAPETAFIITNLMESVVTSGTGRRARALGRPVAGKTGTTNDMKDAWFVGYVPQLVAGVWVGYDQEKSLGAGGSGGQAAAPIWTEFMQRAVAGMPAKSFPQPADITFATINPRTGLLAKEGSPGAIQECFTAGTEPTLYDGELETPASDENNSDSGGLPDWVRAGRLPERSDNR